MSTKAVNAGSLTCSAEREVEREGFEPSMDETAHTGFRDRHLPACKVWICRSFRIRLTRVGKNLGKKSRW